MSHEWRSTQIYTGEQAVGLFTQLPFELYKGLTKFATGCEVLDKDGRQIAFDLQSSTGEVLRTWKTYHIPPALLDGLFVNEEGIPNYGTIEFHYGKPIDGIRKLTAEIYLSGYEHKNFIINDDRNILVEDPVLARLFSWSDNPYYHYVDPLIPA
jgi:hypothetical protein